MCLEVPFNHGSFVSWYAVLCTNQDGQTPLHFASDGRAKVVSALLELKADTGITTKHLGYTALHKAVVGNHIEIAKMLLQAQASTEIQCTVSMHATA